MNNKFWQFQLYLGTARAIFNSIEWQKEILTPKSLSLTPIWFQTANNSNNNNNPAGNEARKKKDTQAWFLRYISKIDIPSQRSLSYSIRFHWFTHQKWENIHLIFSIWFPSIIICWSLSSYLTIIFLEEEEALLKLSSYE